ncbi:MAG: marine proteobacterial sortase target protein [Halioglobus sp.]
MYSSRIHQLLSRDLQRYGGWPHWLLFRCLPALIFTAASIMIMASSHARAGDHLDGVSSGQMLLRGVSEQYHPALTQSTRVSFAVTGMLAKVTVEQDFRNDGEEWVEGIYAFPLPENAAVRSLEMQVGERRIVGKIREREEAERVYKRALKQGKKATLVAQQRPNLFTNRVANIAPGETITVSLEYVQTVEHDSGRFSLRLPTTITPRYMPGDAAESAEYPDLQLDESLAVTSTHGWALPTDQVPDAHLISPLQYRKPGSDVAPLNPIEISAQLDMGMPLASVESPYHEIALSRRAGVYSVTLAKGSAEMNRDFVLQWSAASGSLPGAAFFTQRVDGQYYGLLMLVPPSLTRVPDPVPREIVFVVDTSGSMGGVSIKQARESLDRALRHLGPDDRFNVIEFNSNHRSLFRQAVPANRHNVQLATEFVRHLNASGGTEMMPALRTALMLPERQDEFTPHPALRQIIFITDGAVGNEAALFEEIVKSLGTSRLFTVGIGSAPNSWFMRKAADFGRGTFTYIGDVREVGDKMDTLFLKLSNPVATHISVDWPDGVDVWPSRVPDLYAGEPLLLAVKFDGQLPSEGLQIRGLVGEKEWRRELQFPAAVDPVSMKNSEGVATLWARKKIDGLMDEKFSGKSEQWVRERVLPLALEHSLLSPYTSFIAVEEVVSRPRSDAAGSKLLPNTRPRGQTAQPFAYPNTATTAAANIWLGSFLLLIALFATAIRGQKTNA